MILDEKPYKIPSGWVWSKIESIAKVGQGGTPSTKISEYWNGKVPWLRSGEIRNNRISSSVDKITERGLQESSAQLCPQGTVLLAMTGQGLTRGRCAILDISSSMNQSVAYLIPNNEKVLSEYLFYYLQSQYWNIRKIEKGSNQPGLNTTIIKKFSIPLPQNISIQKRIVSKIEEHFKESKSAREALNNVSQILKKFRYSVLRSAYEVAQDSKWKLMKLRDIIENLQSGFACGKRDENGYIQLRMNNIGLEGKLVTDSLLRVPKSETNIKKYRLKKHDIIFNNTNSPELVGKTIIFNDEIEDCVYSNHLTRIRVNEQLVLPEYLMHFLRLEQKKGTFELLCRRFVGQAAVPRESLLNLDFRLPSIEEQSKVISKLNELFSFAEQIEKSVHEAKKRTDIIDQAILSKAFRGELVPQDPKDEPASVLLDRIRQEKELEIKQTSIE